jgi:hypothetical protein
MARPPITLQQLQVVNPCDQEWDAMSGDDRARFCARCNEHVHDLSRMTRAEVERLLSASGERCCVRYAADADGRVRTLDYAPPRRPRFRAWVWLPLSLLAGAGAALGSFFFGTKAPPPTVMGSMPIGKVTAYSQQAGPVVMGDIAPTCSTTRPAGR